MAIITLMDRIINTLERGHFMVGIFLDFSKAFDTVNHEILLGKLLKYGIRGPAHKWVQHYLSDREQYCYLNGHTSKKLTIKCGVPQGSILGPLLFLVYINDLANFSNIMSSLLFADDSNLFASGPNLSNLETAINIEMPKLVTWLTANRLSLNIGKTHLMVFGKGKICNSSDINVKINNQPLDIVQKSKFLGVIIDTKLSWRDHTLFISKKISKSIAILSLAKKFLNKSTMIQLYYAFVFPHLYYCNLAWGNAAENILWPIYKNQKIALRIISNTPRRNSTIDFCKKFHIFRLPDIHNNAIGMFMFKYNRGLLPQIFQNFFSRNQDHHSYPTRNAAQLRTPLSKTQLGSKFITKSGVIYWNNLPESITTIPKIGLFKKKLKIEIMNRLLPQ
jgi:hypothetical protein